MAKLAIGLTKGEKGETTGTVKDTEGNRDVPSILLDPIAITKDNVKAVIDDGGAKAADVCKGLRRSSAQRHGDLLTRLTRRDRCLTPGTGPAVAPPDAARSMII